MLSEISRNKKVMMERKIASLDPYFAQVSCFDKIILFFFPTGRTKNMR